MKTNLKRYLTYQSEFVLKHDPFFSISVGHRIFSINLEVMNVVTKPLSRLFVTLT